MLNSDNRDLIKDVALENKGESENSQLVLVALAIPERSRIQDDIPTVEKTA